VTTMAMNRKQVRPDPLPLAKPPIRYLTENGFSIVRLSEINPAVIDRPGQCQFLVQRDDEAEREIKVGFDHSVVESLQIRRRTPLSETSTLWVACAESCLATYLWEKNEYPPDGRLAISELSPDELMLALHWRDSD
jgi:hypothetical protein